MIKSGKPNSQGYSSWNIIINETAENGALIVGDVSSVKDRAIYKLYRVKTVIQCGKDLGDESGNKQIRVIDYPIVDNEKYNITEHFQDLYERVKEAMREGGVLIHCFSGISRSPAMVIAYMMRAYLYDYDTALKKVKARRYFISMNDGFVRQLKSYNKYINYLREQRKQKTEKTEKTEERTERRNLSKSPMKARGAARPILSAELDSTTQNEERSQYVKSMPKYDPLIIKEIYTKNKSPKGSSKGSPRINEIQLKD